MRVLILAFVLFVFACSNDDGNEDPVENICYSFDERQCEGNPWLLTPDNFNDSPEDRASALFDYLASQSISVQSTIAIADPNRVVCEACVICPTGTTYFIVARSTDSENIESLDLLNLQEESCAQ